MQSPAVDDRVKASFLSDQRTMSGMPVTPTMTAMAAGVMKHSVEEMGHIRVGGVVLLLPPMDMSWVYQHLPQKEFVKVYIMASSILHPPSLWPPSIPLLSVVRS
jgi:hypothetical protein